MANNKRRKIVKIEDIKRDKSDFLTNPKIAKYEIRAKYRGEKIEVPFEDTLGSNAKKNTCTKCHNEATKMVYISIKTGGLQLERYCPSCFDQVVDLDKMEIRPLDNSHILEKITIRKSRGGIPKKEDWQASLMPFHHVR